MKQKRILFVKNGHFCKSMRVKIHYFGKDDGTKGSCRKGLAKFKSDAPFLKLGIEPEKAAVGYHFKDLLNHFLSRSTRDQSGHIERFHQDL